MLESQNAATIAIDGGGSRCRVACAKGDDVVRVEVGSANVCSDFNGAIAELQHGISKLAGALHVDTSALREVPAFVGLAGMSNRTLAKRVQQALPFRTVQIEDDRRAALRGALGADDGFVVHCGTGSFFASQIGGETRLAGGWGPVLDDVASAMWLGRQALSRSLRAYDGTHMRGALADRMLSDFGGANPIMEFASAATPAQFGALAPQVTASAAEGDDMALSILQDGARHIAETLTALGWTAEQTVCLTGGVGPHYTAYLPEPVQHSIRDPLGEPLDGALALAREIPHVRD